METIEIGLVVIDLESLEIVDEFQRFVRPQIHATLTDFCKKLTLSFDQVEVFASKLFDRNPFAVVSDADKPPTAFSSFNSGSEATD